MTCKKAESTRTLKKAFRFFHDGHVQKIRLHPGEGSRCFITASVLPSMCKDRIYKTYLALDKVTAEVKLAFCVCAAGLSGCCNYVSGLLYALEDFVRRGLREDLKLGKTERLQE